MSITSLYSSASPPGAHTGKINQVESSFIAWSRQHDRSLIVLLMTFNFGGLCKCGA